MLEEQVPQPPSLLRIVRFTLFKIAEQEILQQSAMKHLLSADPADREEVSRRFRRERERLASERDAKVEKIRRGEA